MTIEELHAEMVAGFARIDNRFKGIDRRFKREDDRFKEFEARILADIKREGIVIRTHFDVMVEKMQESVKLVAEATAHHAGSTGRPRKAYQAPREPARA